MALLATFEDALHFVQRMADGFHVFAGIECRFFQMVEETLHNVSVGHDVWYCASRTLTVEDMEYLGFSAMHEPHFNGDPHTAGASLFRPTVRKNSDINWKQSSRIRSTGVISGIVHKAMRWRRPTSIRLQRSATLPPESIQIVYLIYDFVIDWYDISTFDIC